MKKILKLILGMMLLFIVMACNKDDDEGISSKLEYQFTTETLIPDNGNPLIITINVDADRVVVDPSKVFLEITLNHSVARDLSYGYLMPNDGDEIRSIVNNLGGLNAYSSDNTLVFSPTSLVSINPSEDYMYPNFVVSAGVYKEGTSSEEFPVESPLFHNMLDKNILGDWKFFFLDTRELYQGSVIKVKLIFEEGALNND